MPALQHHTQGVVTSLDQENHLIGIEPDGKEGPNEFTVDDKRTRMRRDHKVAVFGDLLVGQHVQRYSKKEGGRCGATEVSWQSRPPSMK